MLILYDQLIAVTDDNHTRVELLYFVIDQLSHHQIDEERAEVLALADVVLLLEVVRMNREY